VASIQELEERRARECRLTPARALETLDEAAAFVADRGLLTRTADCTLPSLFEACHEEPYSPGSRGFGSWPKTKYWWSFELGRRPGIVETKLHRGKTLLLSDETAAIADPICRAELRRMETGDEGWARLLHHLSDAGPSLAEDVEVELDLKPKELKQLRSPLERCGAIVSRQVRVETPDGGHTHASELARWDHVVAGSDQTEPDLASLVVAGVRAAVVCPEQEPARWFSWPWRWDDGLIDRLVDECLVYRPGPGLLAVA